MTLEDLLQDHIRGCYIVNIRFKINDYGTREVEVELHSGRKFTVRVPHRDNSKVELLFDRKVVQE